ncbi:MAG: hypothetical protein AAF206_24975 [Bacteroidota bacterium]
MKTQKIPWWVWVFAVISILSSVAGLYGGYINGAFFYTEFPLENWQNPLVKHLAGMWASKNLGLIVVFLIGLFQRDGKWLAVVFLFKFLTDSIDILYVNPAFQEGAAGGVTSNLISWLILALPGALAAWYFLRPQSSSIPQSESIS